MMQHESFSRAKSRPGRLGPFALLATLGLLLAAQTAADVVQPVSVQIKEQEPGAFLLQWQVPKAIPYAAMPDVALPEECRSTSPRTVRELPGSWLNQRTHVCADGLGGRTIAIQYPIVSPGQGTLLRVELLSGTQLVHMLNPGENSWQVPEERAGLLEAPWETIRSAVLDGVAHLADGWLHLALLLAICLLGGTPAALGLVTAFAGGQLLGVGVSVGIGTGLPSPLAEGRSCCGRRAVGKRVHAALRGASVDGCRGDSCRRGPRAGHVQRDARPIELWRPRPGST